MSSNIERIARRKRQTRLTFDSIHPASSSTSSLSPVNVRYELPGNQKQKQKQKQPSAAGPEAEDSESGDVLTSTTKHGTSTGRSPFKLLPTPARSSQVQSNSSANRSSSIEVLVYSSPIKASRGTSKSIRATPKKQIRTNELDSSKHTSNGSDPEDATPTKLRPPKHQVAALNTDSEEDMFSSTAKPPRLNTNGKASILPTQKPITLSELSEDEIALPARKPKKNIFGSIQPSSSKSRGKQIITLDSDSDSDLIISSPKRSQPPVFISRRPTTLEDSDEDIRPSPLRRNRKLISDDDTDEEVRASPSKRRRPQITTDEDDELVSPTKRRRPNGRGKAKDSSDDDSEKKEASSKRFTRQHKVKRHRTEKEKKLELLKRRRAGEVIEDLTTSESEFGEEESEEELQKLSEFEDDDEEPEVVPKSVKGKNRNSTEGDVVDDSDFVVEDDEVPLGVPDYLLSMPLEFTQAAHKPLKDHFRDVVEWMVKNKIFAAFPRNDEVYNQAFKKLNDESYGLAKSKFTSSQWTKDFTLALYARPHIFVDPLEHGEGIDALSGRPKCDACNHRSHIPSFAIQFKGKAYDKRTLVEIDQASSDSSDADSDDSDAKSWDDNGQLIPPEKTRWFTGRVCKANAEFAHTLIHWKFSLNEWVVDSLEHQGYLTPQKLAERDKMKPKQLNKLADNIVDAWEAQGIIKGLYRDYKNQMTVASELKERARGGWK